MGVARHGKGRSTLSLRHCVAVPERGSEAVILLTERMLLLLSNFTYCRSPAAAAADYKYQ